MSQAAPDEQPDQSAFERFQELAKSLLSVPKKEAEKEAEERDQKRA